MADAHKNFAFSLVATAPSPAASGLSLVVTGGDGTKFQASPFNATVWPAGVQPTSANAEIVRVTNIATDTFTIVRQQEGTSARTIVVGDQIVANITVKTLTDAENPLTGITGGSLAASTDHLAVDNVEVSATDTLELPATSTLEVAAYISQSDTDLYQKTLRDTFMGNSFADQGGTTKNLTLDENKDFISQEVFEVGAGYSFELPATSTLEVVARALQGGKGLDALQALLPGSINFSNLLSTIFSSQVLSYTNTGSGGGTGYYINLGGIKICWGESGTINTVNGNTAITASLPVGFFTTVQYFNFNVVSVGTLGNQYIAGAGNDLTAISGYAVATGAATINSGWIVIGT